MALVKATEWLRLTFDEGSAPDIRTIKKMIKNKQIPGAFIGSIAYVDKDAFAAEQSLHKEPSSKTAIPSGFQII